MKGIKHELQDLINGNGQVGLASQLKKTQDFLIGHAQTSTGLKKQKYLKSKEEKFLIDFAKQTGLFSQKTYRKTCLSARVLNSVSIVMTTIASLNLTAVFSTSISLIILIAF